MQTDGRHATGSGLASPTAAPSSPADIRLAEGLGWGSLGLGAPMLSRPGRFDQAIGVRDDAASRMWTVIVGVREVAAGGGILALEAPRPVGWLWARVAGDVMDLALLVSAWGKRVSTPRLLASTGAVVGIGVADLVAAMRMNRAEHRRAEAGDRAAARPSGRPAKDAGHQVQAAITVNRPRDEVYRFWHELQNLPRFMVHLESVEAAGDGRSHWTAKGPAGRVVAWDAEVVEERDGELIAWQSLDGSQVHNAGSVRFADAPGDRGTEIHVQLRYEPPGGRLGTVVAKLFGEDPEVQVRDDLRRFKQVIETGQVVRSEGTPEGRFARRLTRQRPARSSPASKSRTTS